MENFGKRLIILRKNRGWTQKQLAQRIGIAKSTVSAYERNLRVPSYETLLSFAKLFNVTTDYLLSNDTQMSIDLSGLTKEQAQALIRGMQSVLHSNHLRAVIRPEAGAEGLMQIMPETAQTMVTMGLVDPERFPVDDLANPEVNIEYGCACLEYLSGEFDTVEQVIAAYNAGFGPVRIWAANAEHDGIAFTDAIDYQETRAYVTRVLVSYEGYRNSYPSLYPDPE